MTEAEAREIVVTPEMIAAGDAACRILKDWYRDAYDDAEDGLRSAFPRMLRVWLQQGAPTKLISARTPEAEQSPQSAILRLVEGQTGR